MGRIVATEFISLDGVIEDPGGSEDFEHGGWSFEISRGEGPDRTVLATLRQGDFFGEMSLLESMPREADATAVTHTELLVITQGGLLVRLRRDPSFAVEMLHKLSGRVRALNQQVERDRPS